MQPPIAITQPRWVQDFRAFLMRGNVIDLAVGVVIGAAFTAIVSSLVDDLFNPLIGVAMGGVDFSERYLVLDGNRAATLAATREGGAVVIAYGKIINAIIKFVIVALCVFWLIRVLSRLRLIAEKAPEGPTADQVLLTEIRDELRGRLPAAPPPPGRV